MRVLWFTNVPMPAVTRRSGARIPGSGHWMSSLVPALAAEPDVSLAVATAYPGHADADFVEDGVRYVVLGQPRFAWQLAHHAGDLERCRAVVDRLRPDVIHVHGSERFYGLLAARRLVAAPVVISLQGFLAACRATFFGGLSAVEIARALTLRELATRRGLAWDWVQFAAALRQEREVLGGPVAFLGRTRWDEAQAWAVNPAAPYFHVDETLRPEFERQRWSRAGCRPRSVVFTNAGNPRRGVETLLDALRILAARRPDVQLRLAGSLERRTGYGRFVQDRIAAAGLADRVHLLGFLPAAEVARELADAHAFVVASFVENSPNSLCEAMRVGTPCVAAYAGGIPSLVDDGRTGLLFPPGDAVQLAAHLERLFADDALATRLGAAARAEAAHRHDPARVVRQLRAAYDAVVGAAPRPARVLGG